MLDDGLSLCLLFGYPSHFRFRFTLSKIVYYSNNISSTIFFSLWHNTNCDNKNVASKTMEEGSLIHGELQPKTNLIFCKYEVVFIVSARKRATYLTLFSMPRRKQHS